MPATAKMKSENMEPYRGVEVIGAGWGRTGTNTLMAALEILGYDPTYHMIKVFEYKQAEFWHRAYLGEPVDFREVFEPKKVRATCDFPSAFMWREQLAAYPDAKVILTVRDPEKWFTSASSTIMKVMPGNPGSPFGVKVCNFLGLGPTKGFISMARVMGLKSMGARFYEKESVVPRFIEYNESVKRDCPKDKLLVFEVKDGWEPLCKFLGKPIPDVPFPNVNDTAEFQQHIRVPNTIGWTLFLLSIAAVGVAVWAAIQYS
jgi:hypothetical protein